MNDTDLAAIRVAAYSDAQVVELTTLAAGYTLTNFLNNMAAIEIDIPAISNFDNPTL